MADRFGPRCGAADGLSLTMVRASPTADQMSRQEKAARPAQETHPLVGKVRRVAEQNRQLVADLAHAESEIAVTRASLALALNTALATRAHRQAQTRQALIALHRKVARVRPRRRNRLTKRIERLLLRLGPPGRVVLLAQSGLWRTGGGLGGRLSAWRLMLDYVRGGGIAAAQPPALVSHDFYLQRYPDVATQGTAPLLHYLTAGAAEGRFPHPLFDPHFYAAANAADLGATGLSPLEHFVRLGAARGCDPHPLFSVDWYVAQRADLAAAGVDALTHYLEAGWREGLSPHPLFDPAYYAAQVPPAERQAPPLLHYLTAGWRAGLKPHPLFDPAWYLERYADVAASGQEPLTHYVLVGGVEGRDPSVWFVSRHHKAARDLGEANPLVDYLTGGGWEVEEARPGFSTTAYLASHPELAGGDLTPLEHWALSAERDAELGGRGEGLARP